MTLLQGNRQVHLVKMEVGRTRPSIPRYIPHFLIFVFFLGGATVPSLGELYVPYVVAPMILVLLIFPGHVYLSRAHALYLVVTIVIAISCLVLALQGTGLRAASGLYLLVLAWPALLVGSTLSFDKSRALRVGAYTLLAFVGTAYVSAQEHYTFDWNVLYYLSPVTDYSFKHEIATPFGQSNFLAAFMLFFLAYGALTRQVETAGMSLVGILLTLSRSAAGIAAAFLLVLGANYCLRRVFSGMSVRVRLTLVGVIVGTAVATAFVIAYSNASMANDVSTLTLSSRTILWGRATALVLEQPWVGRGYGSLVGESGDYSVHNAVLDFWLSYGLFSLVSFSVYVVVVCRELCDRARRGSSYEGRRGAAGILLGLILMLIHGMVEPVVLTGQFAMFFGLIAGSVFKKTPTE